MRFWRQSNVVVPFVKGAQAPHGQTLLWRCVGFGYVVASLIPSVYYLRFLAANFANDLWWIDYSATGHESFIIDAVNLALSSPNGNLADFDLLAVAINKSYTAAASTEMHVAYPRRLSLATLTSLEYAVTNLRAMDVAWSVHVNAAWCWVDFDQTFEVAHTLARQTRCARRYADNAAVYTEAMLRNVYWELFLAAWGGPNKPFTVVLQKALDETARGQAWLATTAHARNSTSEVDEVAYWRAKNLTLFQVQWQNDWQVGMIESVTLQNALRMSHVVELKALDAPYGPWTSMVLYWLPINDLWILQYLNMSLVRGATNDFRATANYTLEHINGNCDKHGTFPEPSATLRNVLGPFLAVDSILLTPPDALIVIYDHVRALVANAKLNAAIWQTYRHAATQQVPLAPRPPSWTNVTFAGGNPMCFVNPTLTPFPQQAFDFFDDCSSAANPLSVTLSIDAMLFASLLAPQATVSDICAFDLTSADCLSLVTLAQSLHQSLEARTTPALPTFITSSALEAVATMKVGLVQYAVSRTGEWSLLQAPLVALSSPEWTFVGGLFLFDWLIGRREVVSFEGDLSTLVLVSNAYDPVSLPSSGTHVEVATRLVSYLVAATIATLVLVALLLFGFAAAGRFNVDSDNLFFFNRIVGSVWIGRPLCALRGFTAICILSSSSLTMREVDGYSMLVSSPRSFWQISVLAGETLWLAYVLNDCGPIAHARTVAPISCAVIWLCTILLEAISPVQPTSSLVRNCAGQNYNYLLRCTSGHIALGSLSRVVLLLSLQALLAALAVVSGLVLSRRVPVRVASGMSLHLCRTSLSFLRMGDDAANNLYALDVAACVLSGLLPWCFRGQRYTFDIKTWRLHRDPSVTPGGSGKLLLRPSLSVLQRRAANERHFPFADDVAPRCTWRDIFVAGGGLAYIGASIAGSVSYLELSGVSLANDFYWAAFNSSGTHAFISSWLNPQLVLNSTKTPLAFQLDADEILLPTAFDAPSALVPCGSQFGAHLQHTLLATNLLEAVRGLRATPPCDAPWIASAYCYVDLAKRWEMANTVRRQVRCNDMNTNGAVFLETMLRNIDVTAWTMCYGDAFEMAVASELRTTEAGRRWLTSTTASPQLALSDEATYWKAHGIKFYDTQWQNYKQLGVVNSYNVINAYGSSYRMTLQAQNGSYRFSSQTSWKMYWTLANDLSSIMRNESGLGGLSLLRSSAQFGFANQSLHDVLVRNGELASPLSSGYSILAQRLLGPFGSIDIVYVPVPSRVTAVVSNLIRFIRITLANSVARQEQFSGIHPVKIMLPVPPIWATSRDVTLGGSPLCPESSNGNTGIQLGLLEFVAFDGICSTVTNVGSVLNPSTESFVLAMLLANVSAHSNLSRICALDVANTAACLINFSASLVFLENTTASSLMPTANIADDIKATNVAFFSYLQTNRSSPVQVATVPVLHDPLFDFYGWLFLLEWVTNQREVLSFQGDMGTLTLLSELQAPLLQETLAYEVASNVAQYIHAGVLYVTVLMLVVASLVSVYALISRGHCEGQNLLELSRVGGIVWVGRPLLLLRSMSALSLLSTGSVALVYSGFVSALRSVAPTWFTTLLAASEVTWLVAVVNDVAMAITAEYTAYYATFNSILVLGITAVISGLWPVGHTAHRFLDCVSSQVDFQVHCSSATIAIGSSARYLALVAIVLVCNVACFLGTRWSLRTLKSPSADSLFFSSGAKHLYVHDRRMYLGVYYLDRSSGVLTGLLSLRFQGRLHLFDIKIWRLVVIDDNTTYDHAKLRLAIPLTD